MHLHQTARKGKILVVEILILSLHLPKLTLLLLETCLVLDRVVM